MPYQNDKRMLFVKELLERQKNVGFENYLVPLLIGPTQCGKTRSIRNLAKEVNYGLCVLLLQSEDPTELTGMSKAIDLGKKDFAVSKLHPSWFNTVEKLLKEHEYVIVFLDEIDKAHSDCLASILTLVRNKTLNGIPMDRVLFVAGANGFAIAENWPTELRARFRPVYFDYDWEWEIDNMDPSIRFILKKRLANSTLPKPIDTHNNPLAPFPETPTTYHNLAKDLHSKEITQDAELLEFAIGTLFEPAIAKYLIEVISKGTSEMNTNPEAVLQPKQQAELSEMIIQRMLHPKVVADTAIKFIKFLYGQPITQENYTAYQQAGYYALIDVPMACIMADINEDEGEKVEYVGEYVAALLKDVDYTVLARVALDPVKIKESIEKPYFDDRGVPTIRMAYDLLKGIYEKKNPTK